MSHFQKLLTMDTSVSLNSGINGRERIDLFYPEDFENDDDKFIDFRVSFPVNKVNTDEIFWLFCETTLTPDQVLQLRTVLLTWDTSKKHIDTGQNGKENISVMPSTIFEKDGKGSNVVDVLKIRCWHPAIHPDGKPIVAVTKINRATSKVICDVLTHFLVDCGVINKEESNLRKQLANSQKEILDLINKLSLKSARHYQEMHEAKNKYKAAVLFPV